MNFKGFNPFGVEIDKITGEHLSCLREVSEGWYLDYKRELINQKDIAKQLSGFANQYGGWLIFGINENHERLAGTFDGISRKEIETSLLRIRNAANQNISPYLEYSIKVVDGPVNDIGLSDNKSIIIIFIPEGVDTPYIHSSGRIYLRISDTTEPIVLKDRYVLDQLYSRRKKMLNKRRRFLETKLIGNTNDQPTLNVYLLTNPKFDKEYRKTSLSKFGKIFNNQSGNGKFYIPMDTFHSAPDGLIAKHTQRNNRLTNHITFRWWHEGNALIWGFVPIPSK